MTTNVHHRRTGNPFWGRVAVGVIFVVYAGLGAALLTATSERGDRMKMTVGVVFSVAWMGVLLVAIWRGKDWARCLLAGLLGFSLVAALPMALDAMFQNRPLPVIGCVAAGINLATVLVLLFLPGMRALTKRKHHLDPY